jgi:hypothetical protein
VVRPRPVPSAESKPAEGPAVWHRDRAQPTLARVYVGNGNSLELVSLHVTVIVQGPRARTLVDHVFRNPHDRQLEGTFEYPLPTGASPSYFSMFLGQTRAAVPPRFARSGEEIPLPGDALAGLTPAQLAKQIDTTDWGKLQEARVVGQQKALETYEEVVRGRIDPALLEYAGGNTFRGRVFPIPAKGYNRVLLAYEETLPIVGDRQVYRFSLPGQQLQELRFHLEARASECRAPVFRPAGAVEDRNGDRLVFMRTWTEAAPEGEVVFSSVPVEAQVQATSGLEPESGARYLYARLHPQVPEAEKDSSFARHGVFLLDTSMSETPDRFAVSMRLLRSILEADGDLQHFNVLTFNAGSAWVEPKGWLPNTKEGREKALARLDGLLLEGATDLSAALDRLCEPGFDIAKGTPLSCFLLSDANLTWGETDVPTLVARFERRCPFPTRFFCYRTGLGQENVELFDALARTGGGVFHCFGEAQVETAARAHRRHALEVKRVRFVGGPEASEVLVAGRQSAVHPGGELLVAARFPTAGKVKVVVEGTFQGKEVIREFSVTVADRGELASRAWGELAVAGLLALHDARLDSLVTAYCQRFNIACRTASFLVLENEADYKRFNLEDERGRTLSVTTAGGDLASYLEQSWAARGKGISGREAFARLLETINSRTEMLKGPNGEHVRNLLALLKDEDFELPTASVAGALLKEKEADAGYLAGRKKDRRDVHPYLQESQRRSDAGDVDGAVRVLSSVVEEHAGRGEALRLVGYRLLALKQPAQAARLFARVQRQRPFEPHSYRDLARSLEDTGRFGLAAIQYEAVLAGAWHDRFHQAIKAIVTEEYVRLLRQAVRSGNLDRPLREHFERRAGTLSAGEGKADLRVTIGWNTDATDIDLWVIEPDGTKVFYQSPKSRSGGELSQDMTQGYGPERYQIAKAAPGEYRVIVHYFRANPNLLGAETHVEVTVTRNAGTADERVERRTVILQHQDQQVEVGRIKF